MQTQNIRGFSRLTLLTVTLAALLGGCGGSDDEENNIDSPGRGMRLSDSTLREGLTWGVTDAVATVNDFRLPNNFFTPEDTSNNGRWLSFQELYPAMLQQGPIGIAEMQKIAGYYGPDGDDEHGALFLSHMAPDGYTTFESVVVRMDTLELWVHFMPSGVPPLAPSYQRVFHRLDSRESPSIER